MVSAPQPDSFQPVPLSVVVLIGAGDADDCCAANYERTVFKDRAVVGLAQRHFLTVRADRGQAGELYRRHHLRGDKPALLVLDAAGEVAHSWQECVNPRDVVKVMQGTLKVAKKQAKAAQEMTERFAAVDAALGVDGWLDASRELLRIQGLRYGSERGKARAADLFAELASAGRERFRAALDDPDPASRYDSLLTLRAELLHVDGLIEDLRAAVGDFEDVEDHARVVAEVRGQRLLAEAEALLETGRRKATLKARGLLRELRHDYPDTPAAERAQQLLDG